MRFSRSRLLNRRDVMQLLVAASCAGVGCQRSHPPIAGSFVGTNQAVGHRLRDETPPQPSPDAWQDVGVVIVGAGIAGLAAARRLALAGYDDFVVCELEPRAGGTSSSGQSVITPYPWGAHYLPVPLASNDALIELLTEMKVVIGRDDANEPVVDDRYLCRVPQERLFLNGKWRADLDPLDDAPPAERAEGEAFLREVDRWVDWRDSAGRRAFALPLVHSSTDPEPMGLDAISMAEWFRQQGWRSPHLAWQIDYACRDDYGLSINETSAWAGLFYAASRKRAAGAASQPLLTWPAGNGHIANHLATFAARRMRLHLDTLVWDIVPHDDPREKCSVVTLDTRSGRVSGWRARRVIFAGPQFVARRVVRGYHAQRGRDLDEFQYGSWLVANLHLNGRPAETDVPLAWDNVLYDSPSLGYVVATHQEASDYGPSVWTYYLPFCGADPRQERRRLDELTFSQAAELVLADLAVAHPDLRSFVSHMEIMRWGHAMIRPTPGFISGQARRRASEPWRGVHFANTDLSGVALLEEAFDHGNRAAAQVLASLA